MKIGMVGLGKMGANMTERLIEPVTRWSRSTCPQRPERRPPPRAAIRPPRLGEVAAKLDPPRVAWVMVPAGEPTDSTIDDAGRAASSRAT